jgi:hypothetical protein
VLYSLTGRSNLPSVRFSHLSEWHPIILYLRLLKPRNYSSVSMIGLACCLSDASIVVGEPLG